MVFNRESILVKMEKIPQKEEKEASPWDTPIKNLVEADGDPEPSCFSSWGEFRYRAWELCARWRSILLCC